jgi:hypothetical protein
MEGFFLGLIGNIPTYGLKNCTVAPFEVPEMANESIIGLIYGKTYRKRSGLPVDCPFNPLRIMFGD